MLWAIASSKVNTTVRVTLVCLFEECIFVWASSKQQSSPTRKTNKIKPRCICLAVISLSKTATPSLRRIFSVDKRTIVCPRRLAVFQGWERDLTRNIRYVNARARVESWPQGCQSVLSSAASALHVTREIGLVLNSVPCKLRAINSWFKSEGIIR